MGRVMKSGKVVIVLRGRYAGRKAIIVKGVEAGSAAHKFGHALVVGIDKHPKKLSKSMTKKQIELKSRVKPFIKLINYSHLMPTRYQVDFDLKKISVKTGEDSTAQVALDEALVKDPEKKRSAGDYIKKMFEEGFNNQNDRKSAKAVEGIKFFYQKLRF